MESATSASTASAVEGLCNVGVDRRGNALYKRNPDGSEKMRTRIDEVKVKTNGHYEIRKRTLIVMPFGVVWESSYRRCSMSLRSY